jgi:hypothetical protein
VERTAAARRHAVLSAVPASGEPRAGGERPPDQDPPAGRRPQRADGTQRHTHRRLDRLEPRVATSRLRPEARPVRETRRPVRGLRHRGAARRARSPDWCACRGTAPIQAARPAPERRAWGRRRGPPPPGGRSARPAPRGPRDRRGSATAGRAADQVRVVSLDRLSDLAAVVGRGHYREDTVALEPVTQLTAEASSTSPSCTRSASTSTGTVRPSGST